MNAHTPATLWAHSPVLSCGEKKYDGADVEASLWSSLTVPSSLYPCSLFPGMMSVPCRAELFWSESDRLLGPFSAAGAARPDVTAAEAHRGPIGAQEEEAPEGGKHPP